MTLESTRFPAETLRGLCAGNVHLPGDAGYDAARTPWNVAVDLRPAAVAEPTSAQDVADLVVAAARAGLRLAPQGTGHNPGPLAAQALDDVVIVRTHRMRGVEVEPARRVVRAEAGVVWDEVVTAVAPHGLAARHGSSPDVGVVGYTLGGGMFHYGRTHGLAANHVAAIEIVLADGSFERVSADHLPDLFWALRGGGGSFGVVTAIELDLLPIADVYAGFLLWDATDAEKVLRGWAEWTLDAPDDVSTSFRLLNLPPLPDLPPFLQGRHIAVIDGVVLGSDERGAELLAALRALDPEMDTFSRVPAASIVRLHMDPEGPTPAVSDAALLGGLPDDAIAAFLTAAGPGSGSTVLSAELRQLGGALSRPHPGGGVVDHLDAAFALYAVAIAATPEMGAQGHADTGALVEALDEWATGRHYLNFTERPVPVASGYREDSWARLKGVRSTVDPGGLFVGNHRVPLPFEAGRVTD